MAEPKPLQNLFMKVVRDVSRDLLPKGAVWNAVDFIPNELGAELEGRGAWAYSSPTAGASYLQAVFYAPFIAGGQLLEVSSTSSTLYNVASAGSKTSKGAMAGSIAGKPFMHRDLVIFPVSSTSAYKYDGSAAPSAIATAPAASYGTFYHDYSVLARTSANPTRLFFSDPGDPTTYDTVNSVWDTTHPITGLATVRNAILVFSDGFCERLRGSTPPPGGDLQLDPLFDIGCVDARSIASYGDFVIWAHGSGIYMTDGATPQDLTAAAGVKNFWLSQMSSYLSSTLIFAGGVYRNKYFLTLYDTVSGYRDGFIFDLDSKTLISRISNVPATMFATAEGQTTELYFASRAADRSGAISGFWSPSSSNYQDGNGTAVTPVLETAYYRLGSMGQKRWKKLYLTADLQDPAALNPTYTVSYITDPVSTSYTALSETFAETTAATRRKLGLAFQARGLGIKVTQGAGASVSRIYALEAEVSALEGSR